MKSSSGLSSSDTTYLSVISGVKNNNLLGNNLQLLSGSGLTFVMIEETLGDGEKVLDLQDVSENHPHIKSRSSSYSNIHNDFIRHDKEAKNISRKNSLANIMDFEGKKKEPEEDIEEEVEVPIIGNYEALAALEKIIMYVEQKAEKIQFQKDQIQAIKKLRKAIEREEFYSKQQVTLDSFVGMDLTGEKNE
ncbi:1362_t:CDS:2 [Funneliformis mosseae]|uniref:1362_t:CDS:1 n=1 Tax=Funneliformis mosseae TaxID=27381 RepID=A0A9N8YPQ7_FUNMO|nr:1362_t:CDS:2 [Funneliformis mosseae]